MDDFIANSITGGQIMANKAAAVISGKLVIKRLAIAKINPAPYNPRVRLHKGDTEYERLSSSIDAFGYVDPLIWNRRTGNLVGGHQRFNVLRAKKVKTVDVSVVDLPIEKEKLLNLALNKIKGHWDQEGLSALLAELKGDEAIDVALAGFSEEELKGILDEGETLVEVLAKADGDEDEEEDEDDGGRGGKRTYLLIVECKSTAQRRNLMRRLGRDGFAVRVK